MLLLFKLEKIILLLQLKIYYYFIIIVVINISIILILFPNISTPYDNPHVSLLNGWETVKLDSTFGGFFRGLLGSLHDLYLHEHKILSMLIRLYLQLY